MTGYTQITYEVRDQVAVITLNRPERLNAWTPTMAEEQVDAINLANDDPAVGAIVTTGAGRGFCAGADMQATFQSRIDGVDPGRDTAGGRGGMPAGLDWVTFLRAAKPMVAAVNGPAVGIGVTMCLPMDQIVTSPAAKFGMGFIKMGLVPELASSRLLADRIGFGAASDLCLSGRLISGEEAHRIGLADRIAGADELLDTAIEIAGSVRGQPGAAAAHDQGSADSDRRPQRPRRRPARRASLPPGVLGLPRARRSRHGVHREARPQLHTLISSSSRPAAPRGR